MVPVLVLDTTAGAEAGAGVSPFTKEELPRLDMKDTTVLKVGSEEPGTLCPALLLLMITGDVNLEACSVVIALVMIVSCSPMKTRAGMLLNGDCALMVASSPW